MSKTAMLRSLILMVATITLVSCEEVIELDFNDAAPVLVVEGFVTNEAGPYMVTLTESAEFYDDNTFPARTGATLTITDDLGNEDVLEETAPGIYMTSDLQGQPGVTYTLTVESEGETYVASSTMPTTLIEIDTVEVAFEEESIFIDEGYYSTAYIQDPPEEGNKYRFQMLVNGAPYVYTDEDGEEGGTDDNFYLDGDKFWNGNYIDFFFFPTLELGDTVTYELDHLDPQTFDYYRTLLDAVNGGGVAPSNPLSNFDDRVLGYFGAFSVSRYEVVVTE